MIDYELEMHNFEYFCNDYSDISLAKDGGNRYKAKGTQKLWIFWKARAKLAKQQELQLEKQIKDLQQSRVDHINLNRVNDGTYQEDAS